MLSGFSADRPSLSHCCTVSSLPFFPWPSWNLSWMKCEPWILHHHLRWSAELAWWLLSTLINRIISRLLCWDAELYRLWDILFVFIQLVNSHGMWLFWLPRLYNKYSFVSSGRGPSLLISSFRFNFLKVCVMWMLVNCMYACVCARVHMHTYAQDPCQKPSSTTVHGLSVKPRSCCCGPSP